MQLCVHLALLCALAYSVEAAVESIQLKQRSYTRSFAPEDTQLAKREDIVLDGFEKGLAFYGTVGVGTPPQMIEVLFDTGSSDLVILGVDCSACDRNASGTTYNASTSSTSSILDVTAELRYMSGNVTGTVVADTVSIGSYNLTRQLSIVIESPADLTTQLPSPLAGILGLGLPADAETGFPPPVSALAALGEFDNPMFSFCVDDLNVTQAQDNVENAATLTLGGVDTSKYTGDITWMDTVSKERWAIPLDGVAFNGMDLNISYPNATIDTGTSLIVVSSPVMEMVYGSLEGGYVDEKGLGHFACDSNATLTLTFGGREYEIPPEVFNTGPANATTTTDCIGALELTPVPWMNWIVGQRFLMTVYSAFQFPYGASQPQNARVGFAKRGTGGMSPFLPLINVTAEVDREGEMLPRPTSALTESEDESSGANISWLPLTALSLLSAVVLGTVTL